MQQFVPMTDDMLEWPDRLPGPLVPYQCGFACRHELRAESAVQRPSAATAAENIGDNAAFSA